MADLIEIRTLQLMKDLELRVAEDKPGTLVGYAAVFNSLSQDLGGFREKILPGSFQASISDGRDIRALVNHDYTLILGRTSAGTLRASEDKAGLRVEIDVPDTSYGRDLLASVKRGDVRGMSFGFRVPENGADYSEEDGEIIRVLSKIDLYEVTATSIPAYEDTELMLRVDPSAIAQVKKEKPQKNLARAKLLMTTI